MCRRAAVFALFLQAVPPAVAQQRPPDSASEPVILKSTSRAVQLEVFVNDSSGRPVHGLQKNDFVVTDNGQPRDIRIFAGEIDANQTAPSSVGTVPPAGVYSNRLGMRGARIVTAIVLDAVPRPGTLQKNGGIVNWNRRDFSSFFMARSAVLGAIRRMEPGQTIAIYAACPDLRVVQDYTSDPDHLAASLMAFVPPRLQDTGGKKQWPAIDAFAPPMLSVLRDVAGRMSPASGRKSVVWISQAYGADLNPSAISGVTDSTIAAFNDTNVLLYAVDARFSPTCEPPEYHSAGLPEAVSVVCSQPRDISDQWMEYLATATGGRAFSGGKVSAMRGRDPQAGTSWGEYRLDRQDGIISEALRFAVDDARFAYELGFYVPEAELDGKVHMLRVTIPAKPKFGLRYRSGYTASARATGPPAAQELAGPDWKPEPAGPLNPDEVGIDATIDMAAGTKNELRISLAIAPETVTTTPDGMVVLDATFTQTDASGKQLAKVEESVRVPSQGTSTEMVRYSRALNVSKGAVLLHIRIRDQATNRVGSIAIPIGKP
jgi:VWFA-related protein